MVLGEQRGISWLFIVVIEFLSGDGSEFYCGGAGASINSKSFRDLYGGQAPVVCYIEHQKESKTLVSQHWRFNSGSSKGSVVEKHKAIASVLSKRSYNFLYKISTNVSLHLFCARIGIGRTRFFSSNCSAMMIQWLSIVYVPLLIKSSYTPFWFWFNWTL